MAEAAREPVEDVIADVGTRAKIVAEAMTSFSSLGYAATSMRSLGKSVGIQPATVYNYFATKEEILWHICEEGMACLIRMAIEGTDCTLAPQVRLSAFVNGHIHFHTAHRQESLVINREMRHLSPVYFVKVRDLRRQYEDMLIDILKAGQQSGVFDRGIDRQLAAFSILGMGMHISIWYNDQGRLSVEQISSAYVGFAERTAGFVLNDRTEKR